jgi:hypothetical protein
LINLEPTLRDGEQIRWQRPAAYCVEGHTIAGVLFATTLGLVFMPNRLNRRRDLVSHRIPLDQLSGIGIAGRTRSLYDGGLKRRLKVETSIGDSYLFVVNHPDQVAEELRELTRG